MRYHTLCAALGVLLVAACDGSVTAPGTPSRAPRFDRGEAKPASGNPALISEKSDGEESGGSGGTELFPATSNRWLFGQPESGLVASIGVEPSVTLTDFCGPRPPFTRSPFTGQVVIAPSGRAEFHTFSSESYVEVFEYHGTVIPTSPCELLGAPVVATGRVTLTVDVSDYGTALGFGPVEPGAGVIHATINGIVTLTNGGEARVHGMWQAVWSPDGTLHMDREPIRLTPL